MREPEQYNKKVRDYVQRYALPENIDNVKAGGAGSDSDGEGLSDEDSANSLMDSDDDEEDAMVQNMDT